MANCSVCLESSLHTRKPEPFRDPSDTLPHCHGSAKSPSKLGKSKIAAEKEEKQTCRKTQRLVALCTSLPSGTGATAHELRCQSLSITKHPFNSIQLQRGGLAATNVTYMWALIAYNCQVFKAPARERSLCGIKTNTAGAWSQRGEEEMRLSLLSEQVLCFENTQMCKLWTFNLLQIPSTLNYMSSLFHLSWDINKRKLLAEPVNFILHKVYMTNVSRYCNWGWLAY